MLKELLIEEDGVLVFKKKLRSGMADGFCLLIGGLVKRNLQYCFTASLLSMSIVDFLIIAIFFSLFF